jgi:hypothetical protein
MFNKKIIILIITALLAVTIPISVTFFLNQKSQDWEIESIQISTKCVGSCRNTIPIQVNFPDTVINKKGVIFKSKNTDLNNYNYEFSKKDSLISDIERFIEENGLKKDSQRFENEDWTSSYVLKDITIKTQEKEISYTYNLSLKEGSNSDLEKVIELNDYIDSRIKKVSNKNAYFSEKIRVYALSSKKEKLKDAENMDLLNDITEEGTYVLDDPNHEIQNLLRNQKLFKINDEIFELYYEPILDTT